MWVSFLGATPQTESFLTIIKKKKKKSGFVGQRGLKSLCEESSCVFLLTSAICSQRFRKLSLEGKSLDFSSFVFFSPRWKEIFSFPGNKGTYMQLYASSPSSVVWEGWTQKAVLFAGRGSPHARFGGAPSLGGDCKSKWTGEVHPLGWAGLYPSRAARHQLAKVDFECPTGRGEGLAVGEKTKSKLNPQHVGEGCDQ